MQKLYLSGNEAIAYGLIEAGVRFISGYPGTPSSEIIPSAQKLVKEKGINAFIDWAINEKVAYEVAYSASLCGVLSAVTMKQVGLNVAMDPFMNSAYVGTDSAFVVISVDDPGPHSSQTEQDSRLFAMVSKIPVLDPSTVEEAYEFAKKAVQISRQYKIPVMLRSVTRISHGRADVLINDSWIVDNELDVKFKSVKDWDKKLLRYAATPRQRFILHKTLNTKINEIREKNSLKFFGKGDILIISSGAVFSYLYELIEEYGIFDKVILAKADMPYPLKKSDFSGYKRVITVEETAPVIELQLCTEGRRNGIVPEQGELTPEVCEEILDKIGVIQKGKPISIPPLQRPSLCPGCGHRIALFAVKKVFGKKAIYAGDIGCYTLALNFGITDTVLCMGASISFGVGMKKAFELAGKEQEIVSIIGDSTFYHTGIQPLIDAVHYNVPFLTIILDNQTVAMTGNQKTLSDNISSFCEPVTPIIVENVVRGIGVNFIEVVDPYEFEKSIKKLKEAKKFIKEKSQPAVIIFRHLCINTKEGLNQNPKYNVQLLKELCKGCKICIIEFECPALVFNENEKKAEIDKTLCIGCGCCIYVCPTKAIICK